MLQSCRNAYRFKITQFNVFLVIASVLTSIQGHVLEFTVEPTDTVVEAGQSAVLDCVVKASHHQQSVLIQWLDQDGSKLTFMGDSYRSQLTNGSLYINSVIEEQRLTGNYQCMATLPNFGSIVSRVAKLNIASLSGFEEQPRDLHAHVGQRAHLACRALGAPPPRVRWLKDERPMAVDELRMVVLPSGALEIDDVVVGDQGTYRCNATSLNSYKLSDKATLQIEGGVGERGGPRLSPPTFIAQPVAGTFVEGQNVSLDCAANGHPPPTISWLKDGYPIDMNDLDSRFSLVGTTSSLRITKIQEEDRGTYQCRAQNREDSLDASARILIQVPPKFLKKPQDKTEHATKDVELECSVYGIPEPKIQWFKNGELVKYSDYYKLVNGYNLKIMGLMVTDSGIFQCFASNEAGNIQAAASLRVQNNPEPKKPKPHPPKKVPPQQSKSLFSSLRGESDSANGEGLGAADYAHLLPRTEGAASFDAHAAFNSLKSSGAGGGGGGAQFAFTVRPVSAAGDEGRGAVDGVPGPPRDLRAAIVKGRFVVLSWRPPAENGEDIQAYAVYYRQEGSDRERFQNTTRSKLEEINIAGLTPGRVYRFRVVAYGPRGVGVSSDAVAVTTQSEEHVASAPLAFDAYATGPRSVRISWRPPDTPNGPVLRYTVYYMETSASIEHNVDTIDLTYELTGLAPYTEYSVWAVAVNGNGAGAATEERTVRTFGAQPSEPPINVTTEPSSTNITVRWEPPPPDSQNGVILGYKIKWRRAGGGRGTASGKGGGGTHTAQPASRHYVIEGLDKGAAYQVRLWASNVNGTGPGSEWADVRTFEEDVEEGRVPEQPSSLRVRPTFDTLYVMWAPPSNQNVRVRNYILGWGKGIPDMFVHELEEKNRTYVIDRLEPNSEYVLSLRASNQMGPGPPIYTTVRTQDEPPPEPAVTLYPPMGLKAQVLSPTSVVLYWTDPSLKQSQYVKDNRYYIVQYTDDKMKKPKYLNVTDLNVMVDELKPNTLYDFSVKLVKGRKESSWSMVVQNRTWEPPLGLPPRELDAHFLDADSNLVELTWQLPKPYAGRITGYVILYTDRPRLPDPEWSVLPVKGDVHSSVVYGLRPFTQYHFKVQARNSRGYGPFSNSVVFRTGQNSSGVFSSQVLLYTTISGCLLAVITISGVVGFFCCRKRDVAMSPDRNKKGSQNIKPPDLWIHHDQMELKAMEKRHSHNDGASSSGAMTLPRSMGGNEYEPHDTINTNSLDKRTYVPNYVGDESLRGSVRSKPINFPVDCQLPRDPIATPINTATLSQSSSESTPSSRQAYARTGYAVSKQPFVPSEQSAPQQHHQATENVYVTHPVHSSAYDANVPLISGYIGQPQPVPHSLPTSSGGYAPGSGGGAGYAPGTGGADAVGGAKRMQAQGHPLKSFTVPAPPPVSAPGTPQSKHIVTVRPNTSPYKRQQSGSPGGGHLLAGAPPPSRLAAAHCLPPHTAEEAQRLRPSSSTEELNQEMANLEGLMLTLNAITSNEFEC